MKALVGAFNQEKALVRAFSVIMNLRMDLFQALLWLQSLTLTRRVVAGDVSLPGWNVHGDAGLLLRETLQGEVWRLLSTTMVGDHKSCQQHFAKMVTIFMPPLQDIACDRSVIVMSGDDIMLGDCEAVSVIGDQEEEVIWRNDEVSCCYCCCYGQGLQSCVLGTHPAGQLPFCGAGRRGWHKHHIYRSAVPRFHCAQKNQTLFKMFLQEPIVSTELSWRDPWCRGKLTSPDCCRYSSPRTGIRTSWSPGRAADD